LTACKYGADQIEKDGVDEEEVLNSKGVLEQSLTALYPIEENGFHSLSKSMRDGGRVARSV